MEKEKLFTCDCCGNTLSIDELEVEDGNFQLCKSCYEDNYFYCDDCGQLRHIDEMTYINENGHNVCESCLDNYYYCEGCNEYVTNATYISDRDCYYCEDCFDNNDCFYCYECGDYYSGDSYGGSDGYDNYCDNCYCDSGELLSYHSFNDWQPHYATNEIVENVKYLIGDEKELEPKGSPDVETVISIMNKYIDDVAMEDGSLSFGGAEIISHPRSWEYLQEHKNDYKNFFNEIEDINYGNLGNAGLHFHVTRPNENVITRIIILMESFKDEIKKLSRRRSSQLSMWANFLTDEYSFDNKYKKYQSSKYLKENYLSKERWDFKRRMALNLTNEKTIEFRFFNGVNNFEEYWASLQFIHNLMEISFDETKDINEVKWIDLLQGEELQKQAEKLELLNIDKTAKDTTEIYEKVLVIEETTKNDIKKIINNFIKYVNRELNNMELNNKYNNFEELISKTRDFSYSINEKYSYIAQLVNIYQSVDTSNIGNTKNKIEFMTKYDKYKRYFKQLENTLKNYESEVSLQCV